MNYIVVDLEWNQAMSSKSSVFNKLPIKLRGEIIEIGAVKLDENLQPAEEFTIDVKPVYFKRMHYKVKKITGFDKERLAHGIAFADALEQFRAWCGDGVTFITWGNDDQRIMEQNIRGGYIAQCTGDLMTISWNYNSMEEFINGTL